MVRDALSRAIKKLRRSGRADREKYSVETDRRWRRVSGLQSVEASGNLKGTVMKILRDDKGKVGWILMWALGVPIPILIILFLMRGCT